MPATPPATGDIVKLKITLAGMHPPVWRRILIPAAMTLGDLHIAIQVAMGWANAHLHDFTIAGRRYGDPSNTDEVEDEGAITLAALVKQRVTAFSYAYDFGDNWVHHVTIEGTVPSIAGQRYPACVAGKRACPPEDSGGPYGIDDLLAARADPAHPDHEAISQWLGPDYDPAAFSLAAANAALAARFGLPARKPLTRPSRRRKDTAP